MNAIAKALELLENGPSSIPKSMSPHKLIGNYRDFWECQVMPDLLLIWEQEDEPVNEIHQSVWAAIRRCFKSLFAIFSHWPIAKN